MAAHPEGEFLLPVFPLPNLVFFPHTRLPLHVFEPRYRQLVSDALEGENRFGIVLLRPGWEANYFGTPPVYDCGTLGILEQAQPLDDGRYNILVRGEVRFRVVGEVRHQPYRTLRVIAQPELTADEERVRARREELAELARQYIEYLPDRMDVPEIETVTLDALTNALIMSLNVDVEAKQRLLELDDLLDRAENVGLELKTRIESLRFLGPYRRSKDPSRN
ncbi:MAG TPA: LON peptidase substrate-binding domain-containing protein [Thermoanaerobaculia bacterium]|nr:LON peptidase substrate-binding domain-containing protein [Thermoanaerobaculia bacterium]